MSEFSSTPWKSRLTEYEVFIGHILGVGGKAAKRDKDLLKDLRDSKPSQCYHPLCFFFVFERKELTLSL